MNYENLSHKARVKAKKAYKEDKEFEELIDLMMDAGFPQNTKGKLRTLVSSFNLASLKSNDIQISK